MAERLFSSPKDFKKNLRQVSGLCELSYTREQIRSNTFIKLTINTVGYTLTAFQTGGVDDDGNEIRLSFYNMPTTGTAGTLASISGPIDAEDMMGQMQTLGKTIFKPGTVIFIRDPWLKAAMDGGSAIRVEDSKDIAIVRDDTCCYSCSKSEIELGEKLKRCSRCGGAFYCSRDCQSKDWKLHKKVCRDVDENRTHHEESFDKHSWNNAHA